jgi:quercetin dioxygenase-like cupin family protein
MKHLNDIPPRELVPGITGRYIHGASTTLGYVQIKAGSTLPLHHHVHEQITFIVNGELEMTISGETVLLSTGHVHVIPSNTPHAAIAKVDCTLIDVFSPSRDEYR